MKPDDLRARLRPYETASDRCVPPAASATSALSGLGPDARHELLFRAGVHFGERPRWQRRGVGLVWEPVTDQAGDHGNGVHSGRRRISPDLALPMRTAYDAYVRAKLALALAGAGPPSPPAAAR